jgi:CHAT domain-containing protein/tetratricopeptide (TPR) repeat protein
MASARFLWLSAQSGAGSSSAPQSKDAGTLELRKPVERDLSGGQAHYYQILLVSGQYLHVLLGQRGIDAILEFVDPTGKKLLPADFPGVHREGLRDIFLIIDSSGTYRIAVRPVENNAATGSYKLTIEDLRMPTTEDKSRAAAHMAYVQAEQLFLQNTPASLEMALRKYDEASRLWRSLQDRQRETKCLIMKGVTSGLLGQFYMSLFRYEEAIQHYTEAIQQSRAVGERTMEAAALFDKGRGYFSLGDHQMARVCLTEAIPLLRALGGGVFESFEANAFFMLGAIHFAQGETTEALELWNQSRQIFRDLRDHGMEAQTLRATALVYTYLKLPEMAENYYTQAEQASQAAPMPAPELTTVERQRMTARKHYQEAMRAAAPMTPESLQMAIGKLENALKSYRLAGEQLEEANVLTAIGNIYVDLNQNEKALDYLNQAAQLWPANNIRWKIAVLLPMGRAYHSLGRTKDAFDCFNRVLEMSRAVGDRNAEANVLYLIACADRDRGDPNEARNHVEASLNIFESLRSNISSPDWRASFYVSKQEVYEFYINLLMRMHKLQQSAKFDATAFTASERARARSLVDLLNEARVDIRQGVDPGLLKHERELQQSLNAKSEQQTRVKHTSEEAAPMTREIEGLITEYQEVEAQIRAKSPRYASLTKPLSLREIQQQLLDDDTLLLEYALGEERSFLWAVTATSITSHGLPKRSEIELVASRFYEHLAIASESDALQREDSKTTLRLSQMLLGPIAWKLGRKRLLIVADGALQSLPFGALVDPAPIKRELRGQQLLIVQHEIVSLPSISILSSLRRMQANRPPAPRTLAILADPVFSPDDVRVRRVAGQKKKEQSRAPSARTGSLIPRVETAPQSATTRPGDPIERLPGSRKEALGILALVPASEARQAFDFDASRSMVMSGELSQFRYVHLATHGRLNTDHPELSAVLLSRVNEKGDPEDGDLRLHEIFRLNLPADLVVLSACKTGLGKEIKGEGLIGLTRGFMYAGAARVVVSLWKADDEATAKLMVAFYRGILKDGKRPADALRAAQIEMLKQPQWRAPYYWAAFVLQGEWK